MDSFKSKEKKLHYAQIGLLLQESPSLSYASHPGQSHRRTKMNLSAMQAFFPSGSQVNAMVAKTRGWENLAIETLSS